MRWSPTSRVSNERQAPSCERERRTRSSSTPGPTSRACYGWLVVGESQVHRRALHRDGIGVLCVRRVAGRRHAVCSWRVADNHSIGPDLYNQLFSLHGTAMMFLFAVPVMEAVAIYLVPLMLGTRNVAFPRLNALSYWIYLFGGIMIFVAFALNIGPEAGWFSYVPLAGPEYSAGKRQDFWAQMITFTEVVGADRCRADHRDDVQAARAGHER